MRRNHLKQHSPRFLAVVAKSKQSIHELSPRALKEKLDHKEPLCLIDVREESEWASSGHIPTAIFMSKGIIERDIEKRHYGYRHSQYGGFANTRVKCYKNETYKTGY